MTYFWISWSQKQNSNPTDRHIRMEHQIEMPDDVAAVVSMGALPADRCFFRSALSRPAHWTQLLALVLSRLQFSNPQTFCPRRPALFWQPIMDLHVCDGGLDFKIDIEGGSKRARLPVGKSHPNFSLEDSKSPITRPPPIPLPHRPESNVAPAAPAPKK